MYCYAVQIPAHIPQFCVFILVTSNEMLQRKEQYSCPTLKGKYNILTVCGGLGFLP